MKFPIGGERQPVYDFLRHHGFVAFFSDKHWRRIDGVVLHLYGAGSMARIYDKDHNLITDDALDTAMNTLTLRALG